MPSYFAMKGDHVFEKLEDNTRARYCFILCILCMLMAVVVGLLAFFLFPRKPDVETDGVTVRKFDLAVDLLDVDADVNVIVKNENYAAVFLESAKIDVFHEGNLIGKIDEGRTAFPARETTAEVILAQFQSRDPVVIAGLIDERRRTGSTVTLQFKGPVEVSYLGVSVTEDQDFEEQIPTTSFAG